MADEEPVAVAAVPVAAPVKKPFPLLAKSTTKPATSADPGLSLLPISRVNRIIKADRDVRICSKEALFLVSKATEYMIGKLSNAAYAQAKAQKRMKTVKYQDLAQVVHTAGQSDWFYLAEPIPTTIPLATALLNQKQLSLDSHKLDEGVPTEADKLLTAAKPKAKRPVRPAPEEDDFEPSSSKATREPTVKRASTRRKVTVNMEGAGSSSVAGAEDGDDYMDDDDEDDLYQ